MRAAAILGELQARNMDALVKGEVTPGVLPSGECVPELGELRINTKGVYSSTYGALQAMTPIGELGVDMITAEEKSNYIAFRESYQRQWRRFFDPIALLLTIKSDGLEADLTVRPLIQATTYADMIRTVGNVSLTSGAGDHPDGALLHWISAFDPKEKRIQERGRMAVEFVDSSANPVDSLGNWISIHLDATAFWQKMIEDAQKPDFTWFHYFAMNTKKFPVVFQAELTDDKALTEWLKSFRRAYDNKAIAEFSSTEYKGITCTKVVVTMLGQDPPQFYYAVTPKRFVLAFNEEALYPTLDRILASSAGGNQWTGSSVNVQARQEMGGILQAIYRAERDSLMERAAWANIPILNEWRRRYGAESPVEIHEQIWGARLVCPGGGEYVWNDEYQTYESTVFGHPGIQKPRTLPDMYPDILGADFGLTFEGDADGLRAQMKLSRQPISPPSR